MDLQNAKCMQPFIVLTTYWVLIVVLAISKNIKYVFRINNMPFILLEPTPVDEPFNLQNHISQIKSLRGGRRAGAPFQTFPKMNLKC